MGLFNRDRTNGGRAAGDGQPLVLGGVASAKGVGVRASSRLLVPLGQRCTRFRTRAGLQDDATEDATIRVEVWADDQRLYQSPTLRPGVGPVAVDVVLRGARLLDLRIDDAGDTALPDRAIWADALLTCE